MKQFNSCVMCGSSNSNIETCGSAEADVKMCVTLRLASIAVPPSRRSTARDGQHTREE